MFLHDFDIGDKHRLLVPAVSILDSALIKPITVDNKTTKFDGAVRLLQFQDGAEIARFIARVPEDVLDMDIEFTFDVIFKGQPGPLRVVPNLERTLEVVEAAAAEFVPFF